MKLEIPWFAIPISLLIGIFLAWLVYRNQLNKPLSKWLMALRALGWVLVLLMLFEPTINWITSREVKPLIVLYRDISKSANLDSRNQSLQINQLVKERFNNEIDLELIAFGSELMGESWDSLILSNENKTKSISGNFGTVENNANSVPGNANPDQGNRNSVPSNNSSVQNNGKLIPRNQNNRNSTDLPWIRLSNAIGGETRYFEVTQSLLELKKRNNVVGSILITDGILNSGPSPLGLTPQNNKPLLIIGTGDSSRISDVSVESLICNDDVFLGNNTRVEGEIDFQNWANSEVKLELLDDGRLVQSKIIQVGLTNNSGKQGKNASSSILRRQYQFDYVGRVAGAHFLQVRCSSSQDKNLKNNLLGKSIRVVDRKKKIAIIYGKPHPDVKAIAESLSTTVQNQVSITSENDPIPPADLYILHGIENARSFESIEKGDAPIWVFANTPASLVYANKNSGVSVSNISRITTFQSVGLAPNSEFSLFEWGMDDLSNKIISGASVANVNLQNIWGGVSAVLVKLNATSSSMTQIKQVWNTTVTDFPLCNFNVKGTASSVWFWGEGIWKCRMNEFRKRSSTQYFDAWVNSNVQWLGRNPSENNGLKIVTSGDEVQLGKLSRFKVIRLDAAGNKTNSENIQVQVVNFKGETKEINVLKSDDEYVGNFIPSSDGLIKIKVQLKGNSTINAEKVIQVNSYSLEEKSNRSDFNLLRSMAKNHNGDFVLGLKSDPSSPEKERKLNDAVIIQVEDWITQNKLNQIKLVDENRSLRLKEFWGYLTLIAIVFTLEWILRKRMGQI